MTASLWGAGLLLAAVGCGLRAYGQRLRRQRSLLWSFAASLGEMESAIRWQQTPIPPLLDRLAERGPGGAWFAQVALSLQGGMPLQLAWDSAFSTLSDRQTADILRRVSFGGDRPQLTGALRRAREELETLHAQRCREDRQRFRTTAAAALCGAGLLIILLI